MDDKEIPLLTQKQYTLLEKRLREAKIYCLDTNLWGMEFWTQRGFVALALHHHSLGTDYLLVEIK